ncbi:MAG TPA: phosphoglucosamine mutase [Trueperaceae bacterium]
MTTRRYFGTDGVRGVAGQHPMTATFAFRLGVAAAETLKRDGLERPRFTVGMDTRRSGPMLAHALVAGLNARGADAVWLGVVPTPGVSHLTRSLGADAGIVVSASHNPYFDNGIKFFNGKGEKLSDETEQAIEALLDEDLDSLAAVTREAVGSSRRYRRDDADYQRFLLAHAPYLDGMKVGLDCANGAASEIAPRVFTQIGARLDVINASPDGQNINVECGSTHPEPLQQRVKNHGLEVGIAFDGDADRAMLVDRRGRLVTGDHVMAICALVRGEKEVVATTMSNLGVERYLEGHGVLMHRERVGDRYVFEGLKSRNLELGGEQSGHVLFLDIAPTGDGILTALQLLSAVRKSRRPLEAWMDEIPVFPQTIRNVTVPSELKERVCEDQAVLKAVSRAEERFVGSGRVNVRASGTEPLVRVMVEGPTLEEVSAVAEEIAGEIEGASRAQPS